MKFGIDLGTTLSAVARVGRDGRPVLLPDAADPECEATSSVVHIGASGAFVGTMAEAVLDQDPELQAIRFFKRNMGESKPIWYGSGGEAWTPEGVSALMLRKLRFDAEQASLADFSGAVITVPAHFNDPQRASTLAAAALADIPVLGLIEEPVAAALHYGLVSNSGREVVLVYDFGGGTFDATVMSMDERGCQVRAKTGLTDLGGKELDEKVGEMVLAQFERALRAPLELGARTLLDLRRISEEIKIELCLPGKTRVRRLVLLGGKAVQVEIVRADFDAAIRNYVERADVEMLRCITEAGLRTSDVSSVLLVGGSSMVPAIEGRVRGRFSAPHQRVMFHEPSRSVAFGAAIHALQLSGETDLLGLPPELRGVSGYAVGVRTVTPSGQITIDTLLKKNQPLPARTKRTYYTTRPDQRHMTLQFVQHRDGESSVVPLGELVVGPLRTPRVNYPIEVAVEYRDNGTVSVKAYDAQGGRELEQLFSRGDESGVANLARQRGLVRSIVINNIIT